MKIRESKLFVVLTMIAILIFMQMSIIISEVKAEVITGSEGDVSWSFDSESGTLTFSGSGSISDDWKDDIVSYNTRVKNIEITGSDITRIGLDAFKNCYSLISIQIPNSVTKIGDCAFYNCGSLTNITIPSSVTWIGNYVFQDCGELTSVTIPDSVTGIGIAAFKNCNSLENILLPNSLTSIGMDAFYWCSKLTSITIPSSVTTIGDRVFFACKGLTGITVESSNLNYKDINGVLFNKEGTNLISYPGGKVDKTYIIPNSVTRIEDYAFNCCYNLTSITIPNSVTDIGYGAFYWCSKLTSITIPNSVTSIEILAFYNCWDLTSITVENSNLNYKDIDGILFDKKGTTLIQYPYGKTAESYVIPNSVTSIGDRAFGDCDRITSITVPNSVTSIGEYAFYNCDSLTSIAIPNSVTSIEENSFDSCYNLTIYGTANSFAKTYAEDKIIPYIIDDTAPTIDVSYKDGTITITATDVGVGLANEEFSLDNKEWCASNEFPVDKSGTYTVYARDKLGNIATKEIEVIVEEQDVVDEDKNDEKNETEDNKTTIEESDKTTNDEDNKTNTQEDTNKKPTNIKDGSESPDPFGQYGNKTIISLVIILVIIALIAYSKFKKYNIKN